MTTDGENQMYTIDKYRTEFGSYVLSGEWTFEMLDENFGVEKTFGYSGQQDWSPTVSAYEAKVDVGQPDFASAEYVKEDGERQVIGVNNYDNPYRVKYASMEEFKKVVLTDYYRLRDLGGYVTASHLSDSQFFIDENGNFAFWANRNIGKWSLKETDDPSKVTLQSDMSDYYYFYNKTDSLLYGVKRIFKQVKEVEINEADYVLTSSYSQYDGGKFGDRLLEPSYTDFDNTQGLEASHFLTQNLLNDDDKYEYLVREYEYEEILAADPKYAVKLNGENVVSTKTVYDPTYKLMGTSLKAVNEDGKVLFRLSEDFGDGYYLDYATAYRVNGKTYLECYSWAGGIRRGSIIYLITPDSPDGVKEVARTKPTEVTKTYNAAGVQVNKDTKGLVITDNGMKYLNR